jgi:hypothetical protein
MLDLTLYILPSETVKHDPEKAVMSFGYKPARVDILDHRDVSGLVKHVRTKWYGYLFSCEVIDVNLRRVLPVYLLNAKSDLLVLCQRVVAKDMKYYTTPRIFRNYVDIKPNTLYPKGAVVLRENKITEGWLVSDARG